MYPKIDCQTDDETLYTQLSMGKQGDWFLGWQPSFMKAGLQATLRGDPAVASYPTW